MPLYEISGGQFLKISPTTFQKEGVQERRDLQEMLKKNIGVVVPNAMVLAEEFGEWEESKRRIDLLCLDQMARLVVIELKRSEDGGHMDLQAIRYAAMVSKMTFTEAVSAHATYMGVSEDEAKNAILDFLSMDAPPEDGFAEEIKIVLVSAEFSNEIITTAMWLNEYSLDISCVKLRPHKHEGKLLVDVQTVVPLPESKDYQIKIRRKEQEQRSIRIQNRDMTRYDLTTGTAKFSGLPKRRLVYFVTKEAFNKGFKPLELIPEKRRWAIVEGNHDSESFLREAQRARSSEGSDSEIGRFYTDDDQLFVSDGRTYALTKMWGSASIENVDRIISISALKDVNFQPAPEQ